MNCDQARERLTDHHHDTLEGEARDALSEHLTDCADCALAYCRLQAQLRGIGLAYAERPSRGVRDALRTKVQAEFSPSRWRRALQALSRPVPAYGAVLAAAIPLLVWVFADPPRETDAAPQTSAPARIHDYDATTPLLDPAVS